jgi:hypothetical protein
VKHFAGVYRKQREIENESGMEFPVKQRYSFVRFVRSFVCSFFCFVRSFVRMFDRLLMLSIKLF